MAQVAGLVDVRVDPLAHVYPPEHGRGRRLLALLEGARPAIRGKQLIGEVEPDGLTAALRRRPDNPGTPVVSSLFIQA